MAKALSKEEFSIRLYQDQRRKRIRRNRARECDYVAAKVYCVETSKRYAEAGKG